MLYRTISQRLILIKWQNNLLLFLYILGRYITIKRSIYEPITQAQLDLDCMTSCSLGGFSVYHADLYSIY